MRKLYHLSTCSTCMRIIKELQLDDSYTLQDIKHEKITADQLSQMRDLAGSYEALFSRKAMKYRAMGLNEKTLTEEDYKQLILDEYTFLKRPVLVLDRQIFVGNSKNVVASAKEAIAQHE